MLDTCSALGRGWAKILMMMQSLLSLLIIALLAARAVNVLLSGRWRKARREGE
jgi:ABC-type Fe3+-siderophore transport system permease subunit